MVKNWLPGSRTKKAQAQWEEMLPEERRVTVAKDVLLQLDAKRILASGTYFDVKGEQERVEFSQAASDTDFRDLLPKQCVACAKGAIFVCAVNRQDQVTKKDFKGGSFDGPELSHMLQGLFTPAQLDGVEAAFEGWHDGTEYDKFKYGDDQARPRERRMRRIMRWVIKHGGDFNLDEFTESLRRLKDGYFTQA